MYLRYIEHRKHEHEIVNTGNLRQKGIFFHCQCPYTLLLKIQSFDFRLGRWVIYIRQCISDAYMSRTLSFCICDVSLFTKSEPSISLHQCFCFLTGSFTCFSAALIQYKYVLENPPLFSTKFIYIIKAGVCLFVCHYFEKC